MAFSLESFARELLDRSGQAKPPYSATRVIDACYPTARVVGWSLSPAFDELTTWTEDGHPVIAYRRELPGDELQLAVAHGVAHVVLTEKFKRGHRGGGLVNPFVYKSAADAFSLALLCPLDNVAQRLTLLQQSRAPWRDVLGDLVAAFVLPRWAINERVREVFSGFPDLVDHSRLTRPLRRSSVSQKWATTSARTRPSISSRKAAADRRRPPQRG